jgi:hypothetical protein
MGERVRTTLSARSAIAYSMSFRAGEADGEVPDLAAAGGGYGGLLLYRRLLDEGEADAELHLGLGRRGMRANLGVHLGVGEGEAEVLQPLSSSNSSSDMLRRRLVRPAAGAVR